MDTTSTPTEFDLMVKESTGFLPSELEAAFRLVSDPQDWKGPILASCKGENVLITVEAIKFYTATVPTVTLNIRTMQYTISSIGYRMGPAGDH